MSERRRHGFDEVEMAAVRKQPPAFGLFAAPEETRHAQAIASVEASATPAETELVERIQAMLRTRFRFTPDDVAAYLTEAGVVRSGPQAGNIRRRLASRIINPGKGKWWVSVGKTMTKDAVRSGREITVWQVIQFPAPPLDTPTERG